MLDSVRRHLATAIFALVFAPSAAAAAPTILVKFKQPAGAASRIEALGDAAVAQTANRVSIVRLAAGESTAARAAPPNKPANVPYAGPTPQGPALGLNRRTNPDSTWQRRSAATDAPGGLGTSVDVANGILWAAQKGAKVINLRLGGAYSQTVCDAAYTAEHNYGALLVAAAGNDFISTPQSPAACPGVVGVAATDEFD